MLTGGLGANRKRLPQNLVQAGDRKLFRVESSVPREHGLMIFMPRIEERFEIMLVAADPSYVFRRRAPCPRHTSRVALARNSQRNGLEQDVVNPIVAEIVDIFERRPYGRNKLTYSCPAFVEDGAAKLIIFRVRRPVDFSCNSEFMQVVVLPSHDDLQGAMELRQGHL